MKQKYTEFINKSHFENWIKKLIIFSISLSLSFSINGVNAADSHEDFLEEANTLKELGLFEGSNLGFELSRYGTRVEAAVIIVRLLGYEKLALSLNYSHPFTDVPSWADAYVAYLYHEGLTNGISDSLYGSSMSLTANQFMTFGLRSLAYNDSVGDFKWNDSLTKALELGILDQEFVDYLNNNSNIYRDDMVAIMYNLLNQKMHLQDTSLIDFLIKRRIFTLDQAMDLGIYKQAQEVTFTGIIYSIDSSNKGVITETINDYNYYLKIAFGPNEEAYPAVIKLRNDDYNYECIFTKEAFLSNSIYQNLKVGDSVTLRGEYATNVLESQKNFRYVLIK